MNRSTIILYLIITVLVLPISHVDGANILGFFSHPGKSHFDVFKVLMEELALIGHNVTVVSFYPHSNPPPGYHDISLVGLQPQFLHVISFGAFERPIPQWVKPYLTFYELSPMGLNTCNAILPSDQFQGLLNREDFDLVIIEQFNTDCFLSLVHKLKVPYIGISSCTPPPWYYQRYGASSDPSFVPSMFLGQSDSMSFIERLENTLLNMAVSLLYYPLFERPAQHLVQKYVGEVPPLSEIGKNASLLLTNTHFTLDQPKPYGPKIIEVGGMHVKEAKPLPDDLENFLNGNDGAILFSFGSMMNPDTFPEDKINAFISAFSEIQIPVIWKFNKKLENIPKNVKIIDWLPQRDILAHPNIKGFIGHGGLLGLTEAIYCGKPVLAVPMFGDQLSNVRSAVQIGFAVEVDYRSISPDRILNGLRTILSDKYQERAKELSLAFRDRPESPLKSAVYWVEYVLRHGNTPLKTAAAELTFIQYHLLDVISVIAIFVTLSVCIIKIALRKLRRIKQKID